MVSEPVRWPDEADEVIRGDLTAAAAYVTPACGTVVTSVCPLGIGRREAGEVGFTTSLGFAKKLERIIADPRVALAYHAREHGLSASPAFVLAQGVATWWSVRQADDTLVLNSLTSSAGSSGTTRRAVTTGNRG